MINKKLKYLIFRKLQLYAIYFDGNEIFLPSLKAIILHIILLFPIFGFCQRSEIQRFKQDTVLQLFLIHLDTTEIPEEPPPPIKGKVLTDSLVKIASSYLGDRYRRGGTSTKGFDCSGFTLVVFRHFGIKLPHTSAGQSLLGFEVPKKQIQKGDLLFFRSRSRRSRRIGHVGIVISEKGEPVRFIHSSTSSGVRIDHLDADYYKKRFMKASRVLPSR